MVRDHHRLDKMIGTCTGWRDVEVLFVPVEGIAAHGVRERPVPLHLGFRRGYVTTAHTAYSAGLSRSCQTVPDAARAPVLHRAPCIAWSMGACLKAH